VFERLGNQDCRWDCFFDLEVKAFRMIARMKMHLHIYMVANAVLLQIHGEATCKNEESLSKANKKLQGISMLSKRKSSQKMWGTSENDSEQEKTSVRTTDPHHNFTSDELGKVANVAAETWMSYGWAPNAQSASFLQTTQKLFNYEPGEVVANSWPQTKYSYNAQSSLTESSKQLSTDMGVSGSYFAFSASVASSVETSSNTRYKQMFAVFTCTSSMNRITSKVIDKSSRLMPEVRQYFLEKSPSEIVKKLGQFYPQSMNSGGVIRTTFQQTASSTEDVQDFMMKVKGEGKMFTAKVAASGKVSSESSITNTKYDTYMKVEIEGGDQSAWLANQGFSKTEAAWANTFTPENQFPIQVVLRPIWELITPVSQSKGEQVKQYLLAQGKSNTTLCLSESVTLTLCANHWI
jgi:hypothetical protein